EVLLEGRCAAAAERGPETRDRGAVSYPGLVLDRDDAERREQLLDQVVLFIVERRAAEAADAERPRELDALALAVLGRVLPGLGARGDHPVGDHVHRVVERKLLPLGPVRPAVLDPVLPQRALDIPPRRRAFGAEPSARDRAVRIALDVADLALLHVDQLAAADGAIRADRRHDALGALRRGRELIGPARPGRWSEPERIAPKLANERPSRETITERHAPCVPAHRAGQHIGWR